MDELTTTFLLGVAVGVGCVIVGVILGIVVRRL